MYPSPHRPMCSSNCSHFPHRKAYFLSHTWKPRSQRENWSILLFLPWVYCWGTLQVIEAKLGGQREGQELKQLWHLDWESPGGGKRQASREEGWRPEIKNSWALLSVTAQKNMHGGSFSLPPISTPYLISRGVLKVRNPISFSSGILQPSPPSLHPLTQLPHPPTCSIV